MTLRPVLSIVRRLVRDERGNVLALTAFALPLLIGCAGLAVDTIQWVYAKRDIQSAADTAAIAGVHGLIQGGNMEVAVDSSLSSSKSLDPSRSVSAEQSPDGHRDDPFAVRVRIANPAKLTFSSFFLRSRPIITAEATATVVETGEYCAFALGSDDETGVRIDANASVEMECGVATNASGEKAIDADGAASVTAERIAAFGGINGKDLNSSIVRSYGLKQKDPLAGSEPPLIPNTGCPNITINPDAAAQNGGRVEVDPGCYGNLVVNGPLFLRDGEYILNRGSLFVGPTGELSCKACTIFITSEDPTGSPGSIGKVQIDHHAKVQLAAPTQGPNAGILIYQDRHAANAQDRGENIIGGNSFSKFNGLIYIPAETLRVDGEFTPDVRCARFIGRRLIFKGRLLISEGCSSDSVMNFKGTEVRLIG